MLGVTEQGLEPENGAEAQEARARTLYPVRRAGHLAVLAVMPWPGHREGPTAKPQGAALAGD